MTSSAPASRRSFLRQSAMATAAVACAGMPSAADAKGGAAIEIGSRRELFVDEHLVDRLVGQAELRLHHPEPREVVLVHDAPWEGNATAYHSIFQDGDRYRMYYRAWRLTVDSGRLQTGPVSLCYAESRDGIHWEKPHLRLHEFEGTKANNIVISSELAEHHQTRVGGPAVFKDRNPAASPEARYKTFLISKDPLGMRPFKSADGFRWSPMAGGPTITRGAFDSQNLAFWDPVHGEYRAFWRYFTKGITDEKTWKPGGVRAIRTATSQDLIHWHNESDLTYVDSPAEHLYENVIAPYHRAPHLLIGFPVRYIDRAKAPSSAGGGGGDAAGPERIRSWPASLRALPQFQQRAARAVLNERYGSALTEGLLMASRDGVTFKRWNEAFLRPGIERPGTWNYGHQFVGWHLLETASSLRGAPRELSLYATEGYWTAQQGTSLRRYTLRLDGFVSVRSPTRGGELITKPLIFTGKSLSLNFATSAAGAVAVEMQDEAGAALPGYTLGECDALFGDTVERIVTWCGKRDLSSFAGRPVRLRFGLRDADVFSFRFSE